MGCQTCGELLGAYKHSVRLFRKAAHNIPGAAEDSRLAVAQAERLRLQCKDASDAFMAHWRTDHGNLSHKAAF